MINLYAKNTEYATVTNNGLATLQPITCELKVAINGTWQLYMELPYDTDGKYKLIQPDMLLRVTDINCINSDYYEEKQYFRIADCKKLDATMQVIAYPVGMDARFDTFVHKLDLTGKNASDAISTINGVSNKYTVTTNLTNQKAIGEHIYENQNIISILNGNDGFTEAWGGEIIYDNNNIKVRDNCGTSQTGDVRYGKNITSMTYDYDTSNVVTRIYPKSKNGDILNNISQYKIADSAYVDSPHFNEYPFARIYYMQAPYTLTQTKDDGSDTYTLTAEALTEIQNTVYADLNSMFGDYADAELLRNIDITFFKETYNKTADKDGFKGLAELYWENLCDKTSAQYGHKVLSDEFKGLLKTAVNNAFKSFWTGTAIKYIWKEYVGGYRYELQNSFASKQAELDYKSTWVKKGSAWWYINAEGYHTASSRVDTGTWKWYKPSTGGTIKLYGNKSKNRYIQNQLVKLDGVWYLFDSEGSSVSGTTNIYSELRNSLLGTLFDYPSDTTANASVDYEGQLFNKLYTHMTTYIQDMYSNTNIDEPIQTISVNMVDIQNALGYSNYKDLLRLHLGDTVNCINNKTGVASQSRIIELTYDVLRKYNSNVVIGTASSSVVDILRSIGGQSDDVQLVAGDGISIQNNVISVTNQQVGVQDVQVNGESVVDGKIAYINLDSSALEYFMETENALFGSQDLTRIVNDIDFQWRERAGLTKEVDTESTYEKRIISAVSKHDNLGLTIYIREDGSETYPFYIHNLQHDWSLGGLLYVTNTQIPVELDIFCTYIGRNKSTGVEVTHQGKGEIIALDDWENPDIPWETAVAVSVIDVETGQEMYSGNPVKYAHTKVEVEGETWIGYYIWQESNEYVGNQEYCIDKYLPASEIPESGYATLADAISAILPLYKAGNGTLAGISRTNNLAFFAGADDDLGTNASVKIFNDGSYEGLDKVEDVKVNGNSVVNNKIAYVDLSDYATKEDLDTKQDVLNPMYGMVIDKNNNIYYGREDTEEIGQKLRYWDIVKSTGYEITIIDNHIEFDWQGYQQVAMIVSKDSFSNVTMIDYNLGLQSGGYEGAKAVICLSTTKADTFVNYWDLDTLKTVEFVAGSGTSYEGSIDCSDITDDFYVYVYVLVCEASIYSLAVKTAVDTKQDKLTAGANITIDENNVISATGGGGSNTRELTKAEYDALSEAEKKNGTIYFIKDVNPPSGGGGISDVKVNGASVVDEDGVAHISISIPNNMALCVEGITMNDAQSGVSSDSSIVRMYIPFDTDLDIDDWNVVLRETPSTASWNTYDWRRVSTYSRAGESMGFGRYDSGNHCFRTFGYFLSTKEQQKVTVGGVDYWYSEPLESVNICTTGLTGNLAISGDLIAENSTWDGTHTSLKDTIQAILARLS